MARHDITRISQRLAGAGLLVGALVFVAAAQRPMPPARYLIVSGDSMTGSWDSRDEHRIKSWRSRYGSNFAWFRQDNRDYIVTDSRTLAALQDALAPQREVDSRQDTVNRHQAEVNTLQSGVNGHQAEVNRAQAEVNRQQSLVNEGNGSQSHVNDLQSGANSRQSGVNAEQEKVNQRQAVVNREQDAVNEMEARVSPEIEKALQGVFDAARRQGLTHEVR
jgi:hypothetical protein